LGALAFFAFGLGLVTVADPRFAPFFAGAFRFGAFRLAAFFLAIVQISVLSVVSISCPNPQRES
jgi:hypothetical protein